MTTIRTLNPNEVWKNQTTKKPENWCTLGTLLIGGWRLSIILTKLFGMMLYWISSSKQGGPIVPALESSLLCLSPKKLILISGYYVWFFSKCFIFKLKLGFLKDNVFILLFLLLSFEIQLFFFLPPMTSSSSCDPWTPMLSKSASNNWDALQSALNYKCVFLLSVLFWVVLKTEIIKVQLFSIPFYFLNCCDFTYVFRWVIWASGPP